MGGGGVGCFSKQTAAEITTALKHHRLPPRAAPSPHRHRPGTCWCDAGVHVQISWALAPPSVDSILLAILTKLVRMVTNFSLKNPGAATELREDLCKGRAAVDPSSVTASPVLGAATRFSRACETGTFPGEAGTVVQRLCPFPWSPVLPASYLAKNVSVSYGFQEHRI